MLSLDNAYNDDDLRAFDERVRKGLEIERSPTYVAELKIDGLSMALTYEDGRLVRDMHLFEVKSPAESKGKDDIYKLVATVPGDKAYRPLNEGKCPLIK